MNLNSCSGLGKSVEDFQLLVKRVGASCHEAALAMSEAFRNLEENVMPNVQAFLEAVEKMRQRSLSINGSMVAIAKLNEEKKVISAVRKKPLLLEEFCKMAEWVLRGGNEGWKEEVPDCVEAAVRRISSDFYQKKRELHEASKYEIPDLPTRPNRFRVIALGIENGKIIS